MSAFFFHKKYNLAQFWIKISKVNVSKMFDSISFLLSEFADQSRWFQSIEVYSAQFAVHRSTHWFCFSSNYVFFTQLEIYTTVFLVQLLPFWVLAGEQWGIQFWVIACRSTHHITVFVDFFEIRMDQSLMGSNSFLWIFLEHFFKQVQSFRSQFFVFFSF